MWIPDTLLVAVCRFGPDLPAQRAAEAIAKGVLAAGRPEPDLCPIDGELGGTRAGATGAGAIGAGAMGSMGSMGAMGAGAMGSMGSMGAMGAGAMGSMGSMGAMGAGAMGAGGVAAALGAVDFDERLRRARAVIVGAGLLSRETLPGSPVFEIATRARQAGVPAYAVTAHNELDPFDARMLDLQVVLEANGPRGLSAAGRKLAEIA